MRVWEWSRGRVLLVVAVVVLVWTLGMVITQVIRGQGLDAVRWGVFDLVLVGLLVVAARARSVGWIRGCLVAVAAMVIADAVFDVATARAWYRPISVAMAVAVELPFAGVCLRWARMATKTGCCEVSR